MKALIGTAALALMLAGCGDKNEGSAGSNATVGMSPMPAVPAPAGGDWTEVVAATPEGGFLMGNPSAPVKLVEYASLTCSHCAEFAEKGIPALTERYVKTGRVSLEVRNYVRDPADIAAALLSRCNGPAAYFALTDQLFAAQADWFGKLQAIPAAQMQQISALPAQQAAAAYARAAGLEEFVAARGIPAAKAQQCLSNQEEMNRLVQMGQKANQEGLTGTPTFAINGKILSDASNWERLQPQLDAALN